MTDCRNFSMDRFLKELEEVINMDSGTADVEGCRKAACFFLQRMEKAGLSAEIIEYGAEKRPMVIGVTPGTSLPVFESAGTDTGAEDSGTELTSRPYDFLLVGHLDTVFPRGTAEARPFRLDESQAAEGMRRAYGPGTVDMKAGALLMIYIAEYMRLHHPGIRLCLVISSDEETGSADSSAYMEVLGRKSRCAFVFEGGRKADQFVCQRKGCKKYDLTVRGIASHAGTAPWNGASAIVELARWITSLDKLKRYSHGTSVNIGLIQGGSALNVVPDLASAQVEVRFTDEKEMIRVERAMKRLQNKPSVEGTHAEITILSSTSPLRLTEKTETLMEQMKAYSPQYLKEIQMLQEESILKGPAFPVDFVAAGGLSDANRLAVCGIPIVDGCGPGGGFPHSEKEFVSLETITKRYLFFTGFLPWLSGTGCRSL